MAKKVLLIDYEPRSIERVRTLLPAAEYSVVEAHDGEEGLNTFFASRFDLVLLSGMLPRLPSAEVLREIRRKGGATAPPVLLMVSSYKGTNRKADAQRVGAFNLLVKPFSDQEFREAVGAAIESTNLAATTVRISKSELLGAPSALTSSDIFSDVLAEVGRETPHAVSPTARPVTRTEDEVEKRLRDTLSGILGNRPGMRASTPPPEPPVTPVPPAPPAPPSASPSGPSPARFSTESDIEKLLSDTLSGIRTISRARPTLAPAASPPPVPSAIPEPVLPSPGPPSGPPVMAQPPSQPLASPKVLEPAPPPAASAVPGKPPEPVATVSASGPDRFGQYEILERIASGGMAELYRARRSGVEGFQKIVAIKKILPHLADNDEFITMFADEAKLAAQLNHPNIVHIFDLGKIEAGGYFIAMEYVDGRDLKAILQSAREVGTPLPAPLAVSIASKVASALDYAHRRRDAEGRDLSLVHRDVSPQNILISYEGDIKLCDFGIAKAARKASQTQSGALKGKVQYMSPEQAWGKPLDRRSDIFSLGAVLFEMLTEQKLFRGDSDLTVLEKVRAAQVVAPSSVNPEVPKNLDAIVLKALAREPEERYTNAADMLRDLEAVLYAYTPAPGSADVAIYLHRLQAEEAAAQEAQAREAARAVVTEPDRKRKSKGTPVSRRSASVPKLIPPVSPAVPAPPARAAKTSPVFGALPTKRIEADKKSRTPLYVMIGAAVLVLAAVVWWTLQRPARPSPGVVPRATPLPLAAPTQVSVPGFPQASATPSAAAAGALDPKAVEEEVQRQLAAKKKELQKTLEAGAAKTPREAPAKSLELAPPSEPPLASVPTAEPSPVRVEPTAVPTLVEVLPTVAPPRPPAPAREAEVLRGELVGPGAGVVEPTLLSTPRVAYPPVARQQRVTGKVIVLVLVDEDGAVSEARLQQGVSSKTGINDAVVQAVRQSKFRPATKNGVPVKMWRTIVVEVKP